MQFQFVYDTGADCTSMYYGGMAHLQRDSTGNLVVPSAFSDFKAVHQAYMRPRLWT